MKNNFNSLFFTQAICDVPGMEIIMKNFRFLLYQRNYHSTTYILLNNSWCCLTNTFSCHTIKKRTNESPYTYVKDKYVGFFFCHLFKENVVHVFLGKGRGKIPNDWQITPNRRFLLLILFKKKEREMPL